MKDKGTLAQVDIQFLLSCLGFTYSNNALFLHKTTSSLHRLDVGWTVVGNVWCDFTPHGDGLL